MPTKATMTRIDGQERRQVFAHAVHDVVLVGNKEEADDEIGDDQRDERCCRQVALDAELDGRPHVRGMETKVQTSMKMPRRTLRRILPYPFSNGVDVAVEADDDEREDRKKNTRKGQASQAG